MRLLGASQRVARAIGRALPERAARMIRHVGPQFNQMPTAELRAQREELLENNGRIRTAAVALFDFPCSVGHIGGVWDWDARRPGITSSTARSMRCWILVPTMHIRLASRVPEFTALFDSCGPRRA